MRKLILFFPLLLLTTVAFAEPTVKPPLHEATLSTYHYHRHLAYATVYPGSLRWNVEHIARRYGWGRVVWSLPEDYRWVGKTRIAGHGVTGIFEKLLKDYPVQAIFYQGNHVLVIIPRTL